MKQTKVEFLSYDGHRLVGDLALPKKFSTAVLLVHGIQSYRDEYGFYSDMASYFADNAIASFRFDYRCHGDAAKGMPLQDLTLAGVLNDIGAAFQVLKQNAVLSKYFLVGTSFGGGLTACFANLHQEEVARVLLVAPVISYERDYMVDSGILLNGVLNNESIKSLEENGWVMINGRPFSRALLNEMPYFNAPFANKVPVTIFHGDKDTAEPLEYSQEYVQSATNANLIIIPGSDHGFAHPGDEDLTHPITKQNHFKVYGMMVDLMKEG